MSPSTAEADMYNVHAEVGRVVVAWEALSYKMSARYFFLFNLLSLS